MTSDSDSELNAYIARQRGSSRSRIGRAGASSRDGAGVSDDADSPPLDSRQVASEAKVSPWHPINPLVWNRGEPLANASKTGTEWQEEELDAIVADYFAMLSLDAAGLHY